MIFRCLDGQKVHNMYVMTFGGFWNYVYSNTGRIRVIFREKIDYFVIILGIYWFLNTPNTPNTRNI